MDPRQVSSALIVLAASAATAIAVPLGSAFTYQGQLKDGGSPASGGYAMDFKLFDADVGGTQVGPTLTFDGMGGNPAPVEVINGLFSVALDFGAAAYNGQDRYLEITVEGAAITPRQRLTAAPHARFAAAPWATSGSNVSYTGGNVGIGTASPGNALSIAGGLTVDQGGSGAGTLAGALRFGGDGHGEGIGSKKTAGGNQNGLDLYTNNTVRLSVTNAGNVGIRTASPGNALSIAGGLTVDQSGAGTGTLANALRFGGDSHGEGIGSKQTAGGNQNGLDLFTNSTARLSVTNGGNVGIGTTSPSERLHVAGNIRVADNSSILGLDQLVGFNDLRLFGDATGGADIYVGANGDVGIGTSTPTSRLQVVDDSWPTATFQSSEPLGTWIAMTNTSTGGHEWTAISTGQANGEGAGNLLLKDVTANVVAMTFKSNGNIGIGTTTPTQKLEVAGWMKCHAVQITGGSDLAEPFDVRESDETKPGMVVCIDPAQTGKLRLSSRAYDTTVAGVVSGANGVSPGLTLTQERNPEADGEHLVALTGRVWAYVDADAGGPVVPGDLLTTSTTPGHAMKAGDHDRRPGATLGKAMSALESGRGLVLVLVNLQ